MVTSRLVGLAKQMHVMLITATNQPLEQAIQEKNFREDLYYRLKVLEVCLPPLRERGNDAVTLAEHFVKLHARRYNRGPKVLSAAAASVIARYAWPGNVRELSNIIERAVLLKAGATIEPDDLALRPSSTSEAPSQDSDSIITIDLSKGIVLEDLERTIIEAVLGRTGWNRTRAANLLGLSRETLRYRIEKYDLRAPSTGSDC